MRDLSAGCNVLSQCRPLLNGMRWFFSRSFRRLIISISIAMFRLSSVNFFVMYLSLDQSFPIWSQFIQIYNHSKCIQILIVRFPHSLHFAHRDGRPIFFS